jgi:hypothetical protein
MALVERERPAAPAPIRGELPRPTLDPSPNPSRNPAIQVLLFAAAALLGLLSVICLATSIWAHIVALTGNDPRLVWNSVWLAQPLLVIVTAPIGVIAVIRGVKRDPFGLPPSVWRFELALLVYYGAHFYLFLYRAQSLLRADYTWQMFSAGWILLFSMATAVYLSYLRRRLMA